MVVELFWIAGVFVEGLIPLTRHILILAGAIIIKMHYKFVGVVLFVVDVGHSEAEAIVCKFTLPLRVAFNIVLIDLVIF